MGAPSSVNPFLWLHYRMVGGRRHVIWVLGGFFAVVGAIALITFNAIVGTRPAEIAEGWLVILSLVMAVFLVLLGTDAVRRAIQQDFTSSMMDSHLLMPITGSSAMLGYLTGPPCTLLLLAGATFVTGVPFCIIAGRDVEYWVVMTAGLLAFSAMLWTLSATVALASRGAVSVLWIVIGLSIVGGWFVPLGVPGLLVLIAAPIGAFSRVVSPRMFGSPASAETLAAGILPHVALALTFFYAGTRKYRYPHNRAFADWLGMLLLLELALVGGVGIIATHSPNTFFSDIAGPGVGVQMVGTATALALVAMLAVSAAVHRVVADERRRHLSGTARRVGVFSPLLASVAASAIIVAVLNVALSIAWEYGGSTYHRYAGAHDLAMLSTSNNFCAIAALALGLAGAGLILRPIYRRGKTGFWIAVWWIAIFWVGPILLDIIVAVTLTSPLGEDPTWLMGVSPIGTLILSWLPLKASAVPGLAVQAMIVALIMWITRARTVVVAPPATTRPAPPSPEL